MKKENIEKDNKKNKQDIKEEKLHEEKNSSVNKNEDNSKKDSFETECKNLLEINKSLQEKILRLNAEMQNMNRRFNEEKASIYKYDGEKLIKELLPIIDNFERAIKLDDDNLTDELSKFLSGFKMIYASLVSTLNAIGVKEIECIGKPFDPNKMEAIMTTNIMEEEENVVVEVMQKGYTYNDKVIRVAMVKVNE